MAAVSQNDVLVEVHRVVRTYDGDVAPVRAVRDASLRVHRGEFVTVTGPSGCGKSTLLGLIAGVDRPDDGTVEVLGVRMDQLDADGRAVHRRKAIGMVFQFFNLVDSMTAVENVSFACRIAGLRRGPAERRARDLLDLLGIADKANASISSLSGGQRQRLAIARALANEPEVVLADEPTGALDSDGGQEVLELFRRLNDGGQTILMVTHDPVVAAAGHRNIRMRDGRIEVPLDDLP